MTRTEDSKYGKGRPLCDGKIRYATREAAARKLVKNQALYRPAQQRVYSCGKCDGWHVSSRLPRTAGDEMTSAERPLREIGPTAVPRRAAMNHAAHQEQIRALMANHHLLGVGSFVLIRPHPPRRFGRWPASPYGLWRWFFDLGPLRLGRLK